MSTITNNTNIAQVGSVASNELMRSVGSVISGLGSGIRNAATTLNEELFSGDVTLQTSQFRINNPGILYSTPKCTQELSDLFAVNSSGVVTSSAVTQTTDMLTSTKSCLMKTLSESSFTISDAGAVETKLKTVLQSVNQKSFNAATKELVAEIQAQHTTLVNKTLVAKVKESAAEIGFVNARIIESSAQKTVFVAENQNGEAIVNEITTDASLNIHHTFETVGIADPSGTTCEKIKQQFQEKLTAKGVIASETVSKPTRGVPFLQSSKKAFDIIRNNQKNDNSRSRKLNQNKNRIHNR